MTKRYWWDAQLGIAFENLKNIYIYLLKITILKAKMHVCI